MKTGISAYQAAPITKDNVQVMIDAHDVVIGLLGSVQSHLGEEITADQLKDVEKIINILEVFTETFLQENTTKQKEALEPVKNLYYSLYRKSFALLQPQFAEKKELCEELTAALKIMRDKFQENK